MMYKVLEIFFKTGQKKTIKLLRIFTQEGFSLLEVLTAVLLFSVFYLVYATSERINLLGSSQWQKEMVMLQLSEEIITDTLNKPPPLNDSLTLIPETKNFEDSQWQDYEYKVEWKRFELPSNFSDLLLSAGGSEDGKEEDTNTSSANNPNASILKQVFTQVQTNLKNLIWQIQVTVTEKSTKEKYVLSTWFRNPDAKVQVGGSAGGNSNTADPNGEDPSSPVVPVVPGANPGDGT